MADNIKVRVFCGGSKDGADTWEPLGTGALTAVTNSGGATIDVADDVGQSFFRLETQPDDAFSRSSATGIDCETGRGQYGFSFSTATCCDRVWNVIARAYGIDRASTSTHSPTGSDGIAVSDEDACRVDSGGQGVARAVNVDESLRALAVALAAEDTTPAAASPSSNPAQPGGAEGLPRDCEQDSPIVRHQNTSAPTMYPLEFGSAVASNPGSGRNHGLLGGGSAYADDDRYEWTDSYPSGSSPPYPPDGDEGGDGHEDDGDEDEEYDEDDDDRENEDDDDDARMRQPRAHLEGAGQHHGGMMHGRAFDGSGGRGSHRGANAASGRYAHQSPLASFKRGSEGGGASTGLLRQPARQQQQQQGRGKVKGALLAAANAAAHSLEACDAEGGDGSSDEYSSEASAWSGCDEAAPGGGGGNFSFSGGASTQDDLSASQVRALPVMERLARLSKAYEQHQQGEALRALHAQQQPQAGAAASLALEGSLAGIPDAPPALGDVLDALRCACSPSAEEVAANGPELCPAGVARALLACDGSLLRGVRNAFAAADAAGDAAALASIGAAVVAMLLLNDANLHETLVDDEFFAFLVGSLEYSHVGEGRRFRHVLENWVQFHEVLPLDDMADLRQKVHKVFRLNFVNDCILSKHFPEATRAALQLMSSVALKDVVNYALNYNFVGKLLAIVKKEGFSTERNAAWQFRAVHGLLSEAECGGTPPGAAFPSPLPQLLPAVEVPLLVNCTASCVCAVCGLASAPPPRLAADLAASRPPAAGFCSRREQALMALQELGLLSRQTPDRDRFELAVAAGCGSSGGLGAYRLGGGGDRDSLVACLLPVLGDRLATLREVTVALELLAVAVERDVAGVRAYVTARKGHPQPAPISGAVPHAAKGKPAAAGGANPAVLRASSAGSNGASAPAAAAAEPAAPAASDAPAALAAAAASASWQLLDDGRSIRLFEKLHALDGLLPVAVSPPQPQPPAAAPLPLRQAATAHSAQFNIERRPFGEHGALLPPPDRFSSLLHCLLWRAVDDPEPAVQGASLDAFRALANPDTCTSSQEREAFLQLLYESYIGWLCAPFTLPALPACDAGDSLRAMALLARAWAAAEVEWEERLARFAAAATAAASGEAMMGPRVAETALVAAAGAGGGGNGGGSGASSGASSASAPPAADAAALRTAVSRAVVFAMASLPQAALGPLTRDSRVLLRRVVVTHTRHLVVRLLQPPPHMVVPATPLPVPPPTPLPPASQSQGVITPQQQPAAAAAPATESPPASAAAAAGSSSSCGGGRVVPPPVPPLPPGVAGLVGFETQCSKASKCAIVDALCAFLRSHSYRIKYFVISVGLIARVLRLTRYPDAVSQLAGLRYLKAFVLHHDEFYNRAIVSKDTFADAIAVALRHHPKSNLVHSAVLDVLEQLAKSGMKQLLHHVAHNYKPWLLLEAAHAGVPSAGALVVAYAPVNLHGLVPSSRFSPMFNLLAADNVNVRMELEDEEGRLSRARDARAAAALRALTEPPPQPTLDAPPSLLAGEEDASAGDTTMQSRGRSNSRREDARSVDGAVVTGAAKPGKSAASHAGAGKAAAAAAPAASNVDEFAFVDDEADGTPAVPAPAPVATAQQARAAALRAAAAAAAAGRPLHARSDDLLPPAPPASQQPRSPVAASRSAAEGFPVAGSKRKAPADGAGHGTDRRQQQMEWEREPALAGASSPAAAGQAAGAGAGGSEEEPAFLDRGAFLQQASKRPRGGEDVETDVFDRVAAVPPSTSAAAATPSATSVSAPVTEPEAAATPAAAAVAAAAAATGPLPPPLPQRRTLKVSLSLNRQQLAPVGTGAADAVAADAGAGLIPPGANPPLVPGRNTSPVTAVAAVPAAEASAESDSDAGGWL